MPEFLLTRTLQNGDGTFGTLLGAGLSLVTVERPWLNNQDDVSCIPAGTYQLHRSWFHKHGYEVFQVMNVPDRDHILIHIFNFDDQSLGCIGVGLRLGKMLYHGVPKEAAVESKPAFDRFMGAMTGVDTATLTIEWAIGLPAAA